VDLNGTVKTPFGDAPKKAVVIGGAIAAIAGVIWYRSYRQKQAQAASVAAAGQSEINPATGYPYGSAEDAAALAAQAGYISPGGGGGGGSTFVPGTSNDNPVTNDQWSQKVLSLWAQNDLGDPGPISAALGVYLAGQVPTPDQITLIHTATALAGLPPKEGNGGYPPHINTSNTQNPDPPPSGGPKTYPAWSTSVTAGELVEAFNGQVRDHFGGLVDWGIVVAANPSIESNINWAKDINARTFKKPASYTIPSMTR